MNLLEQTDAIYLLSVGYDGPEGPYLLTHRPDEYSRILVQGYDEVTVNKYALALGESLILADL